MKKILMVEDDAALHQLYRDALVSENILLDGAVTGSEALEKIKKDPPDLIVLDIMLPGGMNGFDVVEAIKKDTKLSHIPILILTNLDSEKESAMAVGASDYLVKANTAMSEVVAKVKKLLSEKS